MLLPGVEDYVVREPLTQFLVLSLDRLQLPNEFEEGIDEGRFDLELHLLDLKL